MGVVYLVRHGQASFGSRNYDALSDVGHRQARVLGRALRERGVVPTAVVSGGMTRHHETARGCLLEMGIAERWDEDTGFNEYDHQEILARLDDRYRSRAGLVLDLVGKGDPKASFRQVLERALERWRSKQHDDDYDETFEEFRERSEEAFSRVVSRVGPSETALVFTSGGPVAAIATGLLQLSDDGWGRVSGTLANASITKVIVGKAGVTLSSLNEHGHLETADRGLLTYR